MKKLQLIHALIATLGLVYSQDYDLIVKSNGDSIACHIDSITDTHIYFKMKSKKYWTYTYIDKTDVSEYKRNAINEKHDVFDSGTSIIKRIKEPRPKNSTYLNFLGDVSLISYNYERLYIYTPNLFLTGKIGIGVNSEFSVFGGPLEKYITVPHHITGNLGEKEWFFEFGLGGTLIPGAVGERYWLYPIFGLRRQPIKSNKINFRVFACFNVMKYEEVIFSPLGISIGSCF